MHGISLTINNYRSSRTYYLLRRYIYIYIYIYIIYIYIYMCVIIIIKIFHGGTGVVFNVIVWVRSQCVGIAPRMVRL
jgi:hypothetical protein